MFSRVSLLKHLSSSSSLFLPEWVSDEVSHADKQVDDLLISIHHHNPSRCNRRSYQRFSSGQREGSGAYLVCYRYARYVVAEREDRIDYGDQ
jgi:hypothetical protein